jgi:hypothetical protein
MHTPPEVPPKRHRRRNIALAVAGVVILIIVVANTTSGHKHAAAPAATIKAAAHTASPDALEPGARKFVRAIRAALTAHGDSNPATDTQLAALAAHICQIRSDGGAQADVIDATASDGIQSKLDMTARTLVRNAEKDTCPREIPVAQTVTYIVNGSPADVTYGPAGTDLSGTVPLDVTAHLGSPSYYAINAQLQGGGQVSCVIKVNGKALSRATASGSYNIADCEISQNPLTGQWEDTNSS